MFGKFDMSLGIVVLIAVLVGCVPPRTEATRLIVPEAITVVPVRPAEVLTEDEQVDTWAEQYTVTAVDVRIRLAGEEIRFEDGSTYVYDEDAVEYTFSLQGGGQYAVNNPVMSGIVVDNMALFINAVKDGTAGPACVTVTDAERYPSPHITNIVPGACS